MSQRTRAQERADEIDISPTKLLADIEAITGERDAALQKAEEYLAGLQRERAEFANYRRRTMEEPRPCSVSRRRPHPQGPRARRRLRPRHRARPATIADDPWVDGVTAIDRKLRALLESEGVTQVDASPGLRSTPASTRRSRPFPARTTRTARSSRRSGAATGSVTGSSGRRSSPSPQRRTRHRRAT